MRKNLEKENLKERCHFGYSLAYMLNSDCNFKMDFKNNFYTKVCTGFK